MAESKNDTNRKVQLVTTLLEGEAIRIRAEPRVLAYGSTPVEDKAANAYYAVYGPAEALQQLRQNKCLANSRPVVENGDESKAYLRNDLAQLLLQDKTIETKYETPVFSLGTDVTVGLYHTDKPALPEDGSNETLSYVVLSARNGNRFDHALHRLADANRQFLLANHIGRTEGEFAIFPVRRSLADAIKHAHPDAMDISRPAQQDPLAYVDSMPAAMQHIIGSVQHDTRFHYDQIAPEPKKESKPAPVEEYRPPITEHLMQLSQHIVRFERIENFQGGWQTQVVCDDKPELLKSLHAISHPHYRRDPQLISFANIQHHEGTLRFIVSQQSFEKLGKYAPQAETIQLAESFRPEWLDAIGIPDPEKKRQLEKEALAIRGIGKKRSYETQESIDAIALTTVIDEGETTHWLVATAPSLERGFRLATAMAVPRASVVAMTSENERPALVRIPVSKNIARQIEKDREEKQLGIEIETTPYDTLNELTAAQRTHAKVATILTAEPPKTVVTGRVRRPKKEQPLRTEQAIRDDAARLLFDNREIRTFHVQRAWVMHQSKNNTSRSKSKGEPSQPNVRLGLKIPASESHGFEEALQRSGFRGLSGRRLVWIGKTGHVNPYNIFELQLTGSDAVAWQHHRDQDPALYADNETKAPFVGSESIKTALLEHFHEEEPKIDPSIEAWKHFARLANRGEMHEMMISLQPDDIRQMEVDYRRRLNSAKSLAGMRHMIGSLHEELGESAPVFLHGGLNQASDDLQKSIGHESRNLEKLNKRINDTEKLLRNYRNWLAKQPRQADGSILLPCLVIPDPRAQTSSHLNVLAQPPELKEGDSPVAMPPLFPQGFMALQGLMHHNKEILLVPTGPEFAESLLKHEAFTPALQDKPVPIQSIRPVLHSHFYRAPTEELTPEVRDARDLVKRKALERLLDKGGLDKVKTMLLSSRLREEHGFGDLVDDRERIGTQQGMMFNLTSKADWTQKIKPLIEEMERARLLGPRRRYEDQTSEAMPDDLLQVRQEAHEAKTALRMLKDSSLAFHLTRLINDRGDKFHSNALQETAQRLCEAMEDGAYPRNQRPMRLYTLLNIIKQTPNMNAQFLESLQDVFNNSCEEIQSDLTRCNEAARDLEAAYGISTGDERQTVGIRADASVMYFTDDHPDGMNTEALDRYIRGHFTGHGSAPMRCVVYLAPQEKGSRENQVLDRLRTNQALNYVAANDKGPEKPVLGQWTARRHQVPSENLTLQQFLKAGNQYFSGRHL